MQDWKRHEFSCVDESVIAVLAFPRRAKVHEPYFANRYTSALRVRPSSHRLISCSDKKMVSYKTGFVSSLRRLEMRQNDERVP